MHARTQLNRVLEQVEKDKPHFKFYGSDVVCDLTAQHTANFTMKGHRNLRFGCHDYGGHGAGHSVTKYGHLRARDGQQFQAGIEQGARLVSCCGHS
jgi:hypothetical protein